MVEPFVSLTNAAVIWTHSQMISIEIIISIIINHSGLGIFNSSFILLVFPKFSMLCAQYIKHTSANELNKSSILV